MASFIHTRLPSCGCANDETEDARGSVQAKSTRLQDVQDSEDQMRRGQARLIYQLSSTLPDSRVTEREAVAFNWFRAIGAKELWRIAPSKDWIVYALQLSTTEPAVFHAITAFAIAQRSIQFTINRVFEQPIAYQDVELASTQLSKASSCLRRYIDGATRASGRLEPVLLCCIFFMCFELLRGNSAESLTHLAHGRRIMADMGPSYGASGRPRSDRLAGTLALSADGEETFVRAFQSLGGQVDLTETSTINADLLPCVNSQPFSASVRFTSASDAKRHLNALFKATGEVRARSMKLAEAVLSEADRRHLHPAFLFCIKQCLSRVSCGAPDPALGSRIKELVCAHDGADRALSLLENSVKIGPLFQQLALMRLQLLTSSMLLKHSTETKEACWDVHIDLMDRMLDLVERLLESISKPVGPDLNGPPRPSATDEGPFVSVALEPAVLPALAMISSKCRESVIRRRAIALLLAARRREGLLQSQALALFHSAFIDIEEEAARACKFGAMGDMATGLSGLSPIDVPEEARFLDTIVYSESPGVTRAVFGRFAHERNGELEIVQYVHSQASPGHLEFVDRFMTAYRC